MLLCAYCSETIGVAPLVPASIAEPFGSLLTQCTRCNCVGPSIAVSTNHMLVRVIALQRQLQHDDDERNAKALKRARAVVKLVSALPFYAAEQQ